MKNAKEREKFIASAAQNLGKELAVTMEKNGVSAMEYARQFQDALNGSGEQEWTVTATPFFLFQASVVNPPPPQEDVGTTKQGLDSAPKVLGAGDYQDSTDRRCGAAAGGLASASVDQLRASSTSIVAGSCTAEATKTATFSTPGKPANITTKADLRRHGAGWGVVLSGCTVAHHVFGTINPQGGGSFPQRVWSYDTFFVPFVVPMHFDVTQNINFSGSIGAGKLDYWVFSFTVAGLSGIDCHSKADNISTTVK
jgi:hypothetical protein